MQDARWQRDRLALQSVRVAAAIPVLVGEADDPGGAAKVRHIAQQALAGDRLAGQHGAFLLGQGPGLVEHGDRDGRHPQVAQECRDREHALLLGRHAEGAACPPGDLGEPAPLRGPIL